MSQSMDNLGIHVSGRGEVEVVPDMARFSLEINRQGQDAVALKKEMDAVMARVLKLTDKLKISRKDVTAASVQIHPNRVYNNGKQSIDGVIASRSIQVVLRDLDKFGSLMNQSLEMGINNIGNVQLDSSERIMLQEQALDAAIEDAKAQAARLARGFGVELGDVKNVNLGGQHVVRPQRGVAMRMESADSDSFSPGEMTVHREVQASFSIVASDE
ncbi:MAG: SIMPL domain-containing protein [Pseudomonadota bacterium]